MKGIKEKILLSLALTLLIITQSLNTNENCKGVIETGEFPDRSFQREGDTDAPQQVLWTPGHTSVPSSQEGRVSQDVDLVLWGLHTCRANTGLSSGTRPLLLSLQAGGTTQPHLELRANH